MKNQKRIRRLFINLIHNENNIFYKILNFLILLLLLNIILLFKDTDLKPVKINEVLTKTIIAKNNIKYFDEETSKKNQEIIKLTTPPVYNFNLENIKLQLSNTQKVFDNITIQDNYDKIKFLIDQSKLNITADDFLFIKKSYKSDRLFISNLLYLFNYVITSKIIEEKNIKNNYQNTGIKICEIDKDRISYTLYNLNDLETEKSIMQKINKEITLKFINFDQFIKNKINKIIVKNIIPNTLFDKNSTDNEIKNKINDEANVFKIIPKDSRFENGTFVTKDNINDINAIIIDNQKETINFKTILKNFLYVLLILTILFLIISRFEKEFFSTFSNYILISSILIFAVIYFITPIHLGYDQNHLYYGFYLLISAFSLSILFLISRTFSLFFTLILSFLFFYITDFINYKAFIFMFFSGISTVLIVNTLNKRIDILIIGLFNSIINVFIALFLFLISINDINIDLTKIIFFSILNGVLSSVLAFLIILIVESLLNTPTIFKLQELAHFSTPLLKKLFNSAIGTYNHSIIVGNLSESAAIEINANSLLAKVGGYYHDIGKLDNPEYFIENQNNFNKHKTLKPTISTAIIKAHVKIGVEKAKYYRLPKKVIDIIEQHHGNALIKFFYEEAVKKNQNDKEAILKMNFHYQNKNPEFPEAAIVLLADQAEAATRSLKTYSLNNIEKIVYKIIDDNFQEGILDNSGLTLIDITKIKKTFSKILIGMYHPRIEYPVSSINQNKINNNAFLNKIDNE